MYQCFRIIYWCIFGNNANKEKNSSFDVHVDDRFRIILKYCIKFQIQTEQDLSIKLLFMQPLFILGCLAVEEILLQTHFVLQDTVHDRVERKCSTL